MTREHKLALIVGFSLILVVGVLISDHVSSTTRSELPDFGHDEAPVPVALAPATIEPEQPAQVAIRVPEPEPEPIVELHFGRQIPDSQPEEAAPSGRGPILASNDVGAPANDPTLVERMREFGGRVVERAGRGDVDLPTLAQTSQGRQEPNGNADQTGGEASAPASRTSPPEPPARWHTVERGQSLYTISQRYYGNGRHWRKLAEANQDRVGDDGTVRQGVRLRIPENLNGVAAASLPPAGESESRTVQLREYTVQSGDTLGVISQRLLGTVRRTEEIVSLNSSIIEDADDIRVGMVLKIPAS